MLFRCIRPGKSAERGRTHLSGKPLHATVPPWYDRPVYGGVHRPSYNYNRMLSAQGANAPGGVLEYFEEGRLVNGFALLAWPADYSVSGVQTFSVSRDGVVCEKDPGEDTATLVTTIELFNPDATWSRIE